MEAGEAVISLEPPQAEVVLQPLVRRGMPLTLAFDPGDQGAVGIGMHG